MTLSKRELARLDLELVRERAKEDLFFLAKEILGYDELTETYHRPICSAIQLYRDDWQFHLHPRGHFKSTIITISETIQDILRNPDIRILIANAVFKKSKAFLGEIRNHFLRNETFQALFPEHIPRAARDQGNSEEFTTAARTRVNIREASIEIASIDSAVVSSHYDKIIFDDIVNKENARTEEQRKKVIESYREYLSLLDPPNDVVRLVGTRWHYFELYGHLLALEKTRREEGRTERFRKFRTSCYLSSGEPAFPERFNDAHLAGLEEEQGNYVFSCQYLNDPQPENEKIFKIDNLRYVLEPIVPKDTYLNRFVTVDPSVAAKDSDDPVIVTTVSVNCLGDIFIERIRRGWWNPDEQIDQILSSIRLDSPRATGIETTAFQKTFKFFLDKEQRTRGIRGEIQEIKRSTATSKVERIKRIQPFLRDGKIYVVGDPDKLTAEQKQLEMELDEFPYGRYDDILDTLADAIEIMVLPPKRRKQVLIYERVSHGGSPYQTGYRYRTRKVAS